MAIIPFDSIHIALWWYFNKPFAKTKGYNQSNWPDGERIQSSSWKPDLEDIFEAYRAIECMLGDLTTARDREILEKHYLHRGPIQAEIGMEFDRTDRGIRYIRDRVIEKLNPEFIKAGIVRPPRQEEGKYVTDEGEPERID